jgi:hypothetical protein
VPGRGRLRLLRPRCLYRVLSPAWGSPTARVMARIDALAARLPGFAALPAPERAKIMNDAELAALEFRRVPHWDPVHGWA